MLDPMPSELARFLRHRLNRPEVLIPGLRDALNEMGRPDLAEVLDLVHRDVKASQSALKNHLTEQERSLQLENLFALHRLGCLGGKRARPTVLKLVRNIAV